MAEDLGNRLSALGWSEGELARRLGVSVCTVSAWAAGALTMPKYAVAYLELALDVNMSEEAGVTFPRWKLAELITEAQEEAAQRAQLEAD